MEGVSCLLHPSCVCWTSSLSADLPSGSIINPITLTLTLTLTLSLTLQDRNPIWSNTLGMPLREHQQHYSEALDLEQEYRAIAGNYP